MRLRQNPRTVKLLLFFCLYTPLAGWALSSDKDQPINIEADSVDIDDKTGVSVYKGNVILTQGSIRLSGDVLTVYTQNGALEKAVAGGNPAHYTQRPDKKNEDMRAEAKKMEYYAETEKLVLLEGAHLWQEGNEFSGNRIEYDTQRDVVSASKAPSGKERVKIIIHPKNKIDQPSVPVLPATQPSQP